MEIIYYTIVALLLYGISDYILNTIEIKMGKRLPNRSLVFFVIIMVLAVSSFGVLRAIYQKPQPAQATGNAGVKQMPPIQSRDTQDPVLPEATRPADMNNK